MEQYSLSTVATLESGRVFIHFLPLSSLFLTQWGTNSCFGSDTSALSYDSTLTSGKHYTSCIKSYPSGGWVSSLEYSVYMKKILTSVPYITLTDLDDHQLVSFHEHCSSCRQLWRVDWPRRQC